MHRLAAICVRRPLFAVMLNVALVVVGLIAYSRLGVDLYPNVDIPATLITTLHPGAGPVEVESGITTKIESAVKSLSGVTSVQSQSVEGLSTVAVSFDISKNGDTAMQEIRDALSRVTDLPHGAQAPKATKIDLSAAPVMRITLSSARPLEQLTRIADRSVRHELERVNGVGQVRLVGGTERQIRITVDPERLQSLGLTVPEIAAGIRQQNLDMPGGRLESGAREITVRTIGAISEAEQLASLTVARRGNRPIQLGDVATVADTTAEARSGSRWNGLPAVSLLVMKQSGQNTVSVIDNVRSRLAGLQATLPPDVNVEVIGDEAIFIRAAMDQIEEHLILGSLFASLVVFFFLRDWRATLVAAVAIPVSLIATFALIQAAGYTLNQVTMLALTLMVGIVIDDAIVVLENIHHVMTSRGLSATDAAIEGTREISLAVLATTLSLLAVFIPVGFMQGLVGRFLSSFGLTSAFAIAVSLFVSFTLTPMMCARLLDRSSMQTKGKSGSLYERIESWYTGMLEWSLRKRFVIALGSLGLTLSVIPLGMMVGQDFRPIEDQARFQVAIEAPEGTSLAETMLQSERMAAALRAIPGVTGTLTTAGGNDGEPVNKAGVYITMTPLGQRSITQLQAMDQARRKLTAFAPGWTVNVQAAQSAAGGDTAAADVEFVIKGPDLNLLNQYALQAVKAISTNPLATDAGSSAARPKPELRMVVDRQRAADLGVSVADVAEGIGSLVGGGQIASCNLNGEEIPVWLQVEKRYRDSVEGLRRLGVTAPGRWISLDNVVRIEEGNGPGLIERLDGHRQVRVFANVAHGSSQSAVAAVVEKELRGLAMADGYSYQAGDASKQLADAGAAFLFAFGMSFLFMYMVLAAQLESLSQPVIILLTLPLSVPCGMLGLVLLHQNMNIFSGLGILLLFGIVKKNAILQITHTNQLRNEGMSRAQAILVSNRDRLRPILMTTLALVAGMAPLAFATGSGSSTSRSIGVLVAGGQTFCLLLTLLMVPVFYTLFEDLRNLRLWRSLAGRFAPVPQKPPADAKA